MNGFNTYPDKSAKALIRVLKAHTAPSHIVQQPYEHNGSVYKRLSNLKSSVPRGDDLLEYALDLSYSPPPIQSDLFKYFLPVCFWAWKANLNRAGREYAGFAEQFFPSLVKQGAIYSILNSSEFEAVENFAIEAILERISQEKSLRNQGGGNAVYDWFCALSAFAIVFPNLSKLWTNWWSLSTEGHAVGVLQYVSCLMYEEEANPIFDAWTAEKGGGPPSLNESGCHFYNIGWRSENIQFVESILFLQYVEDGMRAATERLFHRAEYVEVCSQLSRDWPQQRSTIEKRLLQLPSLLSNIEMHDWPDEE